MSDAPTEESIRLALRKVMDPGLGKDVIAANGLSNLRICGGNVAFDLKVAVPVPQGQERVKQKAIAAVKQVPGVEQVTVDVSPRSRPAPQASRQVAPGQPGPGGRPGPGGSPRPGPGARPGHAHQHGHGHPGPGGQSGPSVDGLQDVDKVIAVASGKGGVGKSTVAVNLALALAKSGARVGLMDADVYGPSVPKMLAGLGMPRQRDGMMVPLEKHGIKFISIGLLTGEESPVIWRGPMASRLVQQFLRQVDWGELDYLLIDLPPGTGDVQLTLVQAAPLSGAVIVTTPQGVAVDVTMRGLRMFEQVQVPILGVVENMSTFVCPHCEGESHIFRHGGGETAAEKGGFPFLGRLPLDPDLAVAGDAGESVFDADEPGPSARAFMEIADRFAEELEAVAKKSSEVKSHPKRVAIHDEELVIHWADDKTTHHEFTELRFRCPCAMCVDEVTGERKVERAAIPEDVQPNEIKPVGNYAIQIFWSDGHSSGIYPFNMLYEQEGEKAPA